MSRRAHRNSEPRLITRVELNVSARRVMEQCASRNCELDGKNFFKSIGKRVAYQQQSIKKAPSVNNRPPTYSIPEEKGDSGQYRISLRNISTGCRGRSTGSVSKNHGEESMHFETPARGYIVMYACSHRGARNRVSCGRQTRVTVSAKYAVTVV